MKQYLFTWLLLIIVLNGSAQKIRFTDTANRWVIEQTGGGTPADFYQNIFDAKFGGDTLLHGVSYKPLIAKIEHHSYSISSVPKPLLGLFREDTLKSQVWCIAADGDGAEHLIYDANWRVNDTIAWSWYTNIHGKSKVTRIDSILINNAWHRTFYMSNANSSTANYTIIEGIGSTCGPAFPAAAYTFENEWRLRCFSSAGLQPPVIPALGKFNNTTSCSIVRLDVSERNAQPIIVIMPNPGGAQMIMKIASGLQEAKLSLVDATGRALDIDIKGDRTILIGQYLTTPGLYAYILQNALTGDRYTGRFIYH